MTVMAIETRMNFRFLPLKRLVEIDSQRWQARNKDSQAGVAGHAARDLADPPDHRDEPGDCVKVMVEPDNDNGGTAVGREQLTGDQWVLERCPSRLLQTGFVGRVFRQERVYSTLRHGKDVVESVNTSHAADSLDFGLQEPQGSDGSGCEDIVRLDDEDTVQIVGPELLVQLLQQGIAGVFTRELVSHFCVLETGDSCERPDGCQGHKSPGEPPVAIDCGGKPVHSG